MFHEDAEDKSVLELNLSIDLDLDLLPVKETVIGFDDVWMLQVSDELGLFHDCLHLCL